MRKKIYIVIYNFPPIGAGRAWAWHHFANKLSQNGYDVSIITTEPSKNDPLYSVSALQMLENRKYNIIRVNDAKFYYLTYSKYTKPKEEIETNIRDRKKGIRSVLIKIYRFFTRIIFYPDRMCMWAKNVRKFLMKQDFSNNDIIISIGFPFSTHYQMYKFAKRKKCKLILDYGDPWHFNPSPETEPKWRQKLDYYIEKKIVDFADYIIVTTDTTYKAFKKIFKINKIGILRQGVNIKDYFLENESIEKKEAIRMVYTGIFYKEIRDPSIFFNALKIIDQKIDYKIEIIIAGRIDPYFSEIISKLDLKNMKNIKVFFEGNIGFNECIKLQNTSDILLFFSNKYEMQVPGKLYEYLATDKPILSISYNKGETEEIIEKHNRGVIVFNDEKLAEKLLNILSTYNKHECFPSLSNKVVDAYDWKNISKEALKIIKRVDNTKE